MTQGNITISRVRILVKDDDSQIAQMHRTDACTKVSMALEPFKGKCYRAHGWMHPLSAVHALNNLVHLRVMPDDLLKESTDDAIVGVAINYRDQDRAPGLTIRANDMTMMGNWISYLLGNKPVAFENLVLGHMHAIQWDKPASPDEARKINQPHPAPSSGQWPTDLAGEITF